MPPAQRLLVFWIVMVLCMMLHFSYHVSGIFYGIDVKTPTANGSIPDSLIVIRLLFNIIPMGFALALTLFSGKAMRLICFIAAALYVVAHAFHLLGELKAPQVDPSQILLLTFTLGAVLAQTVVSFRWWRAP